MFSHVDTRRVLAEVAAELAAMAHNGRSPSDIQAQMQRVITAYNQFIIMHSTVDEQQMAKSALLDLLVKDDKGSVI